MRRLTGRKRRSLRYGSRVGGRYGCKGPLPVPCKRMRV